MHACLAATEGLTPFLASPTAIAGSSLSSPAFIRALHASLRALIDDMGINCFNVGMYNIDTAQCRPLGSQHGDAVGRTGGSSPPWDLSLLEDNCQPSSTDSGDCCSKPVVARIVSRGRISAPASDFGCLEVVGGASIGHTDPYKLMATVEARLKR